LKLWKQKILVEGAGDILFINEILEKARGIADIVQKHASFVFWKRGGPFIVKWDVIESGECTL